MTDTMQVAETIKAQLGGHRAMYMVGAKNIFALGAASEAPNGGLQFQVMRNARGVTHVRIVLEDNDTYTVVFHKVTRRGLEIRELGRFEMVYADSLRRIFESETGLYLSL